MRPTGIIVFERLMLAALAVSTGLWIAVGLFTAIPLLLLAGVTISATLTLFVSRRRSEIAYVVTLVSFVMRLIATPSLVGAYLLVSPAILVIPTVLLATALEGLACGMLITPKVREWMMRPQPY